MEKLDRLTDSELLTLLKDDSQAAMNEMFNRYWKKLLVTAANNLQSIEEAEDCVQEIFARLWKLRNTLQLTHSLHTYLSIAVKYGVIDRLNKHHHRRLHLTPANDSLPALAPSVEDSLLNKELWNRLEATINNLPEKCRIVFRLRHNDGLSNKEIAGIMKISEKGVEANITRAIKEIKGKLNISTITLITLFIESQSQNHL